MGVGGRWKNGKCGMRVASDKWESVADGEEWRERGGEREVEREPERESLKEKA